MRITKDITRALGFTTRKKREEASEKLKESFREIGYCIFGGLTFLAILAEICLFS